MNEYRFDMGNFTIGDAMQVQNNTQRGDVYGVLLIANRFIPINLFALPISEVNIVLNCFLAAVIQTQEPAPNDPIDQLIRKALEDQS